MRGLLADADVRGQVRMIAARCIGPIWSEYWLPLGIVFLEFEDVGLSLDSPDSLIWHTCQREHLLLITGNRNSLGADSLGATIKTSGSIDSLPVLTLANPKRLQADRDYADEVIGSLIEVIIDIESLRGSGRLFLPRS